MTPNPIGAAVGLLVAGVVFWALQRRFAVEARPRHPWQRAEVGTDLLYWFFNPFVTKTITRGTTIVAVVLLALATGVELQRGGGIEPFVAGSPIATQPLWLQAVETVVLLDVLGYWIHRAFHRGRLWPFHAVHHSPKRLDWLAAARLHPVNDALGTVLRVIPLLMLGFDPRVLAGAVPFVGFYGLLLHANVPWTYGPLRFVIASPAFHRWHHTTGAHGRDKNFAGLLPVLDLLFGTFHMPVGEQPREFGVDDPVPRGLLRQLAYPFRGSSQAPR